MFSWAVALVLMTPGDVGEFPRVLDPFVEIELVASEPEIVTPTGLVVDGLGRVVVVECHTHFPPEGYPGPKFDRIRAFEDRDHDGRYETITTLHEGTHSTMGLALAPDGSLLVTTRNELFRLVLDKQGNVAERRPLAKLETEATYPHNGLSGLAITFDGTIYLGMGENMGQPFVLKAQDGSSYSAAGRGGSVFRLSPEGTNLTRIAGGFWNPFGLARDPFGRLFAVDNDPDSRPPCRLLHVVEGGDYGFRFRYGRKGLNPLTAWNGELPGTLPMISGTGEAPSGVLVYGSHMVPEWYGQLLVTSWGDHRIDRFRLIPDGASFRAEHKTIVQASENFRPVAIAEAPDGSIYFSDWVDRSYPVHGKGRIWRLKPKPRLELFDRMPHSDRAFEARAREISVSSAMGMLDRSSTDVPRVIAAGLQALEMKTPPIENSILAQALHDPSPDVRLVALKTLPDRLVNNGALTGKDQPAEVRAEALRRTTDRTVLPNILDALKAKDPFLKEAAVLALRKSQNEKTLISLQESDSAEVRLGSLLALREIDSEEARKVLPQALRDDDTRVRIAAVLWVVESDLKAYRGAIEAGLSGGPIRDRLFGVYLAGLQRLDEEGGTLTAEQERPSQTLLMRLVTDEDRPPSIRRLALRHLDQAPNDLPLDRLGRLAMSEDSGLSKEAARALRDRPEPERFSLMKTLATGSDGTEPARAEAIAGLADAAQENKNILLSLAENASPALRRQAARSLRGVELTDQEQARLRQAGVVSVWKPEEDPVSPKALDDPDALTRGNPAEGERVFFHPKGPACYRCHQVDGQGGRIGPELSTIGQGSDLRKLAESILEPSREIAPQFTPWQVAKTDGTVVSGVMIEERGDSHLYADSQGRTFLVKKAEVEERVPTSQSIMPDDLNQTLSARELRDLLAYLRDPQRAETPKTEAGSRP